MRKIFTREVVYQGVYGTDRFEGDVYVFLVVRIVLVKEDLMLIWLY